MKWIFIRFLENKAYESFNKASIFYFLNEDRSSRLALMIPFIKLRNISIMFISILFHDLFFFNNLSIQPSSSLKASLLLKELTTSRTSRSFIYKHYILKNTSHESHRI